MRVSRGTWRRTAAFLGALITAGIAIALLLHWGLLCTNIHVHQQIDRICIEHMSGEAIGNLCEPLCILQAIQTMSCRSSSVGAETIFTAVLDGKQIVFKSAKNKHTEPGNIVYWVDERNQRHYPSDKEFTAMIKSLVRAKLNITITDEQAKELSVLPVEEEKNELFRIQDSARRTTEMDNIWLLLQSNDYLLTMLYASTELFPKRVGTCGSMYAVEYFEPIKKSSALFSLEDTNDEWDRRSRLAVLIMELLEKFKKHKLIVCEVDLTHFGTVAGKLKYWEAGLVRPGKSSCKDSLQAVCEKVFLGWAAEGRVLVPGLLVSKRAPIALSSLIHQCADSSAPPPPPSLRRALFNTLLKRN